jgi:hypothetical protein
MKRLIAATFSVLALLATSAYADENFSQAGFSQAFADDHNFVAPAQ